MQVKKYFCWSY